MHVAKIFKKGRSQIVRLPEDFRFEGGEVLVRRVGSAVLLVPKEQIWEVFMEGLNGFSEDFMCEGRELNAAEVVKRDRH